MSVGLGGKKKKQLPGMNIDEVLDKLFVLSCTCLAWGRCEPVRLSFTDVGIKWGLMQLIGRDGPGTVSQAACTAQPCDSRPTARLI